MKVSEAPRSGWYPDPEGGSRLRWWDGTDWSDRYRSRPDAQQVAATRATTGAGDVDTQTWGAAATDVPPVAAAVVDQVRMAARQEAHMAAEEFSRRAREITGTIPPLISQYTNKFMRWLKIGMTLAFLVLLIWLVYQVWVQKSIFDWIGDRIDNLSDDESAVSKPVVGVFLSRG